MNNKGKKVYPEDIRLSSVEAHGQRVLVAMSGGVDSSVAALLLKQATPNNFEKLFGRPTPKGFRGYDVSGAYMRCWPEMREGIECMSPKDNLVALQVAAHLDIPFQTFNFEKEYRDTIFQYFLDEYKAGRTPNPDVMCNKHIKFGIFLKKALELGFDYVATGHYVRSSHTALPDRQVGTQPYSHKALRPTAIRLFKAKDTNKDQSYFLCQLTQEQLQHALFPIGESIKPEVRDIAKKHGLPNADKKDSQGLCFVGHIELPKVLAKFMELRNGPIADKAGNSMGEHIGLNAYTIGQRSHLNIGGTGPWYVAGKDYKTNTLIVAKETDAILYKDIIKLTKVNLINDDLPTRINVKIRYRQPDVPAMVEIVTWSDGSNGYMVKLLEPQKGVAEGQFLVLYNGEELLGGGVIEESHNSHIANSKHNTRPKKELVAI